MPWPELIVNWIFPANALAATLTKPPAWPETKKKQAISSPPRQHGHVAELVGIEGGVVSGVINLESSGV